MRVRLLARVADNVKGDIITVTAEQAEKLKRTGYAEEAPAEESTRKAKAA